MKRTSALLLFLHMPVATASYAGLPAYQQIASTLQDLTNRATTLASLLAYPTMVPNPAVGYFPTTIADGKPVTNIAIPLRTITNFYSQDGSTTYTYQQISAQMAVLLGSGGTSGYSEIFKQAWELYTDIVSPANPAEFFQEHGLGIQAYAGLASSCITYLKAVLSSITMKNYAQADLDQWLSTELASLDAAVDGAAKHFAAHMGTTINSDLAKNFMTIKTNYYQRKAQLLLAWLEPLVAQIETAYPLSAAQTKLTTDLSLQKIMTYTQLLFDSLSVFSTQKTITTLGTYSSVADIVTAFSNRLADLFLYQANLFSHAVEYNIQLWGQPGVVLTVTQMATLTSQLQTVATLYSKAASYYATAGSTISAQAYAQKTAAVQAGLQSWQTATNNSSASCTGQNAQLLDAASQQFQQAGFVSVSSYLYQTFQQMLLLYDQSLMSTYADYYQPLIASYSAQAQQVPTTQTAPAMAQQHQQFQSFFYPVTSDDAQNAAYKGIGWLAQLALPSYQDILSTLQTVDSSSASASNQPTEQQLLQQTITVLQSIAQGSQYILYSSPQLFGASTAPADQNSSSYTITGLVTSIEQYNTIINLFKQADAATKAAGGAQSGIPFAQLFPTSGPVTNWTSFIMLHQAYWLLTTAQQAYAYITQCTPSTVQTDELLVSALFAYMQSQAIYRTLGITPMVNYIQTQITTIVGTAVAPVTYNKNTVEKIIITKAASYLAGTNLTLLARQAALGCYQLGGLLGFESCRTQFFTTLDAYRTVLLAQTTGAGLLTPLAKAFGLLAVDIQGMYAQQAGWQTTDVYKNNYSQDVAALTTQLAALASPTGTIDQQIELQKEFVLFYQQYQAFEVEQKRLAALYGISVDPYLTTKKIGNNQVAFYAVPAKDPIVTLAEPSYQLANLLVQSASSQLAVTQKSLDSNSFSGSLLTTISTIEGLYNQAIEYYSKAGLQDTVIATEKLKTKAMALLYYSLVVPSQKVLDLQQQLKTNNTLGAQTTKNTGMPDYLLRSVSVDITALAQSFNTSASLAQAVTQSSSLQAVANTTTSSSALTAEIAAAQQLLKNAQQVVATTAAINQQALISNVLVPLYRIQLQQQGYAGFLTLDQKVQAYQDQITTLMTTGMTVGSVTYKASYTVTTEKNADGTDHIIVQGTNVPLSAVIQYQGQTESALLYYTLCQKFYDTTQPTTSLGQATYMTITDTVAEQKIADAKQLTYLVGVQNYLNQIATYLSTLTLSDGKTLLRSATLAQKAGLNFSDYQSQYAALTNLYIGALGLLEASNQQESGLVDVATQVANLYTQFAQTGSYFLMGNPNAASFSSVLKDVANNYYAATTTQPMALLYEAVGDYAATLPLPLTQINGYPTATGTDPQDPTVLGSVKNLNQLLTKNSLTSCATAVANPLYLYTQPLAWYNYQQAAAFYQQAYTVYQEGLSVDATNTILQDPVATRLYGKFFYYSFFSSVQTASLFARNAYQVGFDTSAQTITGSLSPDFAALITQGGTAGTATATTGFDSLTSGQTATTNQYASQQYALMRSMLLNAIMYLTVTQGALNQLIQTVGVASAYTGSSVPVQNPLSTQYGQLLQCSFMQYIPGLQVLIGGANVTGLGSTTGSIETLKNLIDIPTYMVDLQTSFKSIFQARIFHATTFLTAMQYMVENSIGTPATSFKMLGVANNSYLNLLVFNKLVTEVWSVMRDLYGQAFLADLYGKDVTAYENALDAALTAQQQQTIINPASYIG